MKYLLIILCLAFASVAFAQQPERRLIQFSGIIHNADSAKVIIQYVTITNKSYRNQVNTANYEGYFSFVAHERDTLVFSCVGYFPMTMVLPDHLPTRSYIREVVMKAEIMNLPAVRIFPWATEEEFRKDFLTMKIADDELEIARKNLNLVSILDAVRRQPLTGAEPINVQQVHNNMVNSHSYTNPLLNPFAWGALINEISAGDKARSGSGSGNNNTGIVTY
jgi:hypothetical protein